MMVTYDGCFCAVSTNPCCEFLGTWPLIHLLLLLLLLLYLRTCPHSPPRCPQDVAYSNALELQTFHRHWIAFCCCCCCCHSDPNPLLLLLVAARPPCLKKYAMDETVAQYLML